MHMTTLRRIEAGEQEPKISEAVAIAKVLNIPVDLLTVDGNEDEKLVTVMLRRAEFKESVNDAILALQKWSERSDQLANAIIAARKGGVPESLLIDSVLELTRAQDIDSLEHLWSNVYTVDGKKWLDIIESDLKLMGPSVGPDHGEG